MTSAFAIPRFAVTSNLGADLRDLHADPRRRSFRLVVGRGHFAPLLQRHPCPRSCASCSSFGRRSICPSFKRASPRPTRDDRVRMNVERCFVGRSRVVGVVPPNALDCPCSHEQVELGLLLLKPLEYRHERRPKHSDKPRRNAHNEASSFR
jgi:hypothetical protein